MRSEAARPVPWLPPVSRAGSRPVAPAGNGQRHRLGDQALLAHEGQPRSTGPGGLFHQPHSSSPQASLVSQASAAGGCRRQNRATADAPPPESPPPLLPSPPRPIPPPKH